MHSIIGTCSIHRKEDCTLKAIQIKQTGGPEVLELTEIATPQPLTGQVLIEVEAAGVNFGETMMRQGNYPVPLELPSLIGTEIAGRVCAVGEGVGNVVENERVMVTLSAPAGYAEYAVADATQLIPLPDNVEATQALGLLSQGLTAYGLLHAVGFAKDKRVLVTAAAGGVGSLIIQLARLHGAKQVIGAAGNEAKLQLIQECGADASINYHKPEWHKEVVLLTDGEGVDLIFDAVSGSTRDEALLALAPFGTLVIYGASTGGTIPVEPDQLNRLIFNNQSLIGFAVNTFASTFPEIVTQAMTEMLSALAEGHLTVITNNTFPLEQAAEAHRAIETRQTVGKVVLVP